MKINKMLIAVLAMVAVVLSSCKDDDPTVGIDSNMPAPATYYDAEVSVGKTIGVYWNAKQAISAGATSFTVQLIKTPDGVADLYDNTVSQTLEAVTDKGVTNDIAKFDNLAKGRIYYVRVRANYPRSVFSEWVLAAVSESDPKEARIMVGKGIVSDEEGETSSLEAKFITSTESAVTVAWTASDNWSKNDLDASLPYRLELFKDKECKNLVVAWNASANIADATSSSNKVFKLGTRFTFSGLASSSTYYFRVTNTADNVVADPVECKTTESHYKALPATAAPGDIILFQDFHEIIYGGDIVNEAAGVSTTQKGKGEQFYPLEGDDPSKDSEKGLCLCSGDREIGLFNTLKSSVAASTTLQDWGRLYESESTKGSEGGTICARSGLLKMGASKYRGCVVTPELKCLTQPATLELSFRASAFDGGDENQTIIVQLLDGTKIDGSYWVTATSMTNVGTGATGTKAEGWKDYTFKIENVTATSRIAIGGENGGGSTQHRFLLDDISLKLISYGELTAPDAPAKPELTATDKTITATWEKVNRANGYKVEYKKADAAEWTVAAENVAETTFTIEGLDFETAYDVRVSSLLGDLASEPSEVAQISTLAEIKKLGTPTEITAVPGLGWVWLKFTPVTNATGYEVYAGDTKVESKIMSKDEAATTVVCAYGLNLNAAFALKVKAVADGIESSDLSEEVTGTTGNIKQLTNNVGPTHLSINWDDVSGGTAQDKRAYYVELSKEQSMANPVYAVYCCDGQASTNGSFGASSWYGKAADKNLAPPTSVTFGQLDPQTTYYFRVKTVSDYTFESQKGTVKLNATNGASEFSPVVSFTTEAKHAAAANEILFEGFDDITMQADFINIAAGTTPYASDKAAIAIPHMGDWCVYPFANSHLMSTWGMAAAGDYIDGSANHNIPQVKTDGKATNYKNYIGNDKAGSLKGWYFGDQVSPHQGYVKVGNSSYSDFYIATPALTSSLLEAAGTACTFSFKGCLLMTDGATIDIEVYRAATNTIEVVKTITLESGLNNGWTKTDYVAEYKWTTYSADITLHPGDNVAIVTKAKNRMTVDDILIVKK